ncbi:MAG: hypothetical protein IK121_04070 [Lachnospiraceae bacterium]|nr:hypothetical protein [Lachnospiraceae bacterium]
MEKDLFKPIKEYFEGFGYVADGEVCDIDLYMEKGDKSVSVELKQTLDFKAVVQAALRQKVSDTVFIGIFRPKDLFSKSFQNKTYLLKRLGIGLIVVSKRTLDIEIVSEPVVSELSKYQIANKNKQAKLSEEFQNRRIKNNTGGVTHTKLMTEYRENALMVLAALDNLGGVSKGCDVAKESGISNATTILRANYYGWFSKEAKGIYKISKAGYEAMAEYAATIEKLK